MIVRPRLFALLSLCVLVSVVLALLPERDAVVASPSRDLRFGIVDGYRNAGSKEIGIGWQRVTLSWGQIQPNGPDGFRADFAFPPDVLQRELESGIQVVGLLQFTPGWAQSVPLHGGRSVPKNLWLGWDDPQNYWGQFVRRVAAHYAGRVDSWVIWNEPEIHPADVGGAAWTWGGGHEQYAQLLRVAYMNVKAANPNAKVVFAGMAYWHDRNAGREQFLKRTLVELARDPNAARNNWYMDVVAYDIYRAADDVYRVADEARQIMWAQGVNKPLWLTETNAMPYDPAVPCAERFAGNPSNVSLDAQASYAVQVTAMALDGGWDRIGFYQATDNGTCHESAIWGLIRDDGSRRPAFAAFKTAVEYLSGAERVTFAPYEREQQAWGLPWPRDPSSYYPNWRVYQVVADRWDQRISVLWNADGVPLRVRVPKVGVFAYRVDTQGNRQPLAEVDGWYVVDLAPAVTRGAHDPLGYYYIGGEPVLVVQYVVPPGTPVAPPGLDDPGSQVWEFQTSVSPQQGQKVAPGEAAKFVVGVRGYEGFSEPVRFALRAYSTQRDPQQIGWLPPSLSLSLPAEVQPGQSADVVVQTGPDVAPGIHFVTLQLEGGGMTRIADLVVQVE